MSASHAFEFVGFLALVIGVLSMRYATTRIEKATAMFADSTDQYKKAEALLLRTIEVQASMRNKGTDQ